MSKGWFGLVVSLQVLAVLLGAFAWLMWFGVQVKGVEYHFTTNAIETTDELIRRGSLVPRPGTKPVAIAMEYSNSGKEAFFSITRAAGLFVIPLSIAAINLVVLIIARARAKNR